MEHEWCEWSQTALSSRLNSKSQLVSHKTRLKQVKEPCAQPSDDTGASIMPKSHSHGLSSSCSFITPARFGIQPWSAGCMGHRGPTTQTGREWRARQAPLWHDLYSPQSLKLEHNNRWTNEAKGKGGGGRLVLDINSWRSVGEYSVFLQGGHFTPGVCGSIASKWLLCTEQLLYYFLMGTRWGNKCTFCRICEYLQKHIFFNLK